MLEHTTSSIPSTLCVWECCVCVRECCVWERECCVCVCVCVCVKNGHQSCSVGFWLLVFKFLITFQSGFQPISKWRQSPSCGTCKVVLLVTPALHIHLRLDRHLETAGISDPFTKIYITTTPIEFFPLLLFLFTIYNLSNFSYYPKYALSSHPFTPLHPKKRRVRFKP